LAEADHPLDRFGLRRYFSALITLDDCIVEEERAFHEKGLRLSLKKPDPFMLDLVAQRVNRPFTGAYYLGDMPDDMQAARASRTGYRGIGVLVGAAEPEVLRQDLRRAGAEHIIADYGALSGIVA
jgi:phosphoglycolate phosphatase-like HAD superfamily hydrolase